MASDPILFDSEEFDLQDKENKLDNDNSNFVSDLKVNQSMDKNAEKETMYPVQEDPDYITLRENIDKTENLSTPSSQDILDSIPSNVPKKTEENKVPQTISSSIPDEFNEATSSSLAPNKIIHEMPDKILEAESTKENPSNSSKISDTPKSLISYNNFIPNTLNDEIPNCLLDTGSMKENMVEPMELPEMIEEPESADLADDVPIMDSSENAPSKKISNATQKHCSLPLSRVKLIMKTDSNVKVVSAEATILAAIAAEKFLKFIIQETCRITKSKNKRTMMKQHFDEAIQGLEVTEFLEGMMDDDL